MKVGLIIGAVVIILIVGIVLLTGNGEDGDSVEESDEQSQIMDQNNSRTQPNGLFIEDTVVGEGPGAENGNTVSVHYTGTLDDGTVFDSSVPRGTPFSFTLGARQVIPGCDQGILGMKVGGKRKLVIPPELAYGDRGAGGAIPPGATLNFEVEMLEIQ